MPSDDELVESLYNKVMCFRNNVVNQKRTRVVVVIVGKVVARVLCVMLVDVVAMKAKK